MNLQVKGRNVEITPALREHTEAKLAKVGKLVPEGTAVEIEVADETKHNGHTAAGTVFAKGSTLHAEESATDLVAAIDLLADNLERQVLRYREKRREEPRRRAEHH